MTKRLVLLILVSLAAVNCQNNDEVSYTPDGDDGSAAQQASNASAIFSDGVGGFEVMVFYEVGADPYVGNLGATAVPVWDLSKKSFAALFNNHVGRFIYVPNILGQMVQLPDQVKTSWTQVQLQNLAIKNAPPLEQAGDVRLSVFFVNGTLNGDSSILGLHVRGTQYVFIFKDAVVAAGGDALSQRYIEQAIVIHELGHAAGLVNNGVPVTSAYEDPANPRHSKNPECVMNAKIESRGAILGALAGAISSNRQILFGNEVLVDGRSYHP